MFSIGSGNHRHGGCTGSSDNTGTFPSYGAMADLARDIVMRVLLDGESKGKDSLRTQTAQWHLERASTHIMRHVAGDRSEPNLDHAITRIVMAIVSERVQALDMRRKEYAESVDDDFNLRTPTKHESTGGFLEVAPLRQDEFTDGELDR